MTTLRANPLIVAVVAAVLAGACGSEPGPSAAAATSPTVVPVPPAPTAGPIVVMVTPAPEPTATPAPTPSATPSAQSSPGTAKAQSFTGEGDIRDVLFAPDGRIVVVESDWALNRSRVVSLDAYGRVLPGWPWSAGDTGNPIAGAALGPEGSVYVAVRGEQAEPHIWSWKLHRLDAGGLELPGFPVALPDVPFCSLAVAGNGSAYALCQEELESTGSSTTSVLAVRPDGSTPEGWPVKLDGAGEITGFRPDGALVLTVRKDSRASVTVLREDGTPATGWPRVIPNGAESVAVDRQGRIHVTNHAWTEGQCGPATRTTYTVFAASGKRVHGWPVTVRGWASEPLIADDGSVTIATDTNTVVRYGRKGNVLTSWPVKGVPVTEACYDGSSPVSAGKDGFVVSGEGRVTLLRLAGRIARGWPVRSRYALADSCHECTPGPAGPLDPAIGRKGIWVAAYRGDRPRVVGIARDGSMPKGWQHAVGKKGDGIHWIRTAPDGRVWMLLDRWVDAGEDDGVGIGILVPVAEDQPLVR